MRIPRWFSPAALAAVVLCLGLTLARLPEYTAGGRMTMVFVSFLASALLGGFSTLYVYVFKPHLGAATGHVLLSLTVFFFASILAFALPTCPSDPTGARCTPSQAVESGFAMMLVALCFSIVLLLWHVTKRSVQMLFRPFHLQLPSKVRSRPRRAQTKVKANVKVGAKAANAKRDAKRDAKRAAKTIATHGVKHGVKSASPARGSQRVSPDANE